MNEAKHSHFEGFSEYVAAIDTVIARAERHIRIYDHNLENMGFNTPQCHDRLHRFLLANPENRLRIVVRDNEYLTKRCPRMLMLLQRFSHNMAIQQIFPDTAGNATSPFVVADNSNYARRYHFDSPRGVLSENDPHDGRLLVSLFEEIWAASAPTITPSISGL